MEGFLGETKEERITIVDTGGDKAMNKNRGGVGGEGGTEAIYVTKMEVGSAGGDVDMGFEGEWAIEDDTQTLHHAINGQCKARREY